MTDAGHVEAPSVLIVVPARAEGEAELDPLLQTLVALRSTAPEAMTLVVDRSPQVVAQLVAVAAAELQCAHAAAAVDGHTAALNVGLRAAAAHGMDAAFVAPGVVPAAGWLGRLRARTGTDGAPAAVAGGAVVEPNGLIRQAGYFFSLFRRNWSARLYRVPEALLDVSSAIVCPTSLELQLVRREWIERVGDFDESLEGPEVALDHCLRVTAAGGECVLEPSARARALALEDQDLDDTTRSAIRLRDKHAGMSFQRWAPEVI
jgi:hypothetical protein